ncbi:methionine adenosyltransferase [Mediterraneibacter gnavus]|uniref:methionine adenosyltransferase n=1 Tax=Mediterraneibacter gnavus TaxID=33038 RepID=UPI0035688E3D
MKRYYTAEAVTEGHPDKLCDQIADAILDECLKNDEESKVACEVLATKGNIFVAGEITSSYEPDVFGIVRKLLTGIGYSTDGIEIDTFVHQQSPDIARAVAESREKREGLSENQTDWFHGAGDQGVMIGYACDETPQLMPMPVVLANRIVRELSACRCSEYIQGILPDGKAQVTVEYENGKPVRVDSVIVSCQHVEDKNLKKLETEIRNKVLLPALRPLPADEDTRIYINPSGRFVCGGLDADTGLTGRKLMVDAYGSMVPHGGGAFSGKDCSKVDRSAAYMARYIAKNMVAAGLASRCQVSLAYAIGVAQPVMVQVDTFGTGKVCEDDCLALAIPLVFGLTPQQIIHTLRLTRPIFRQTAAFGHFGRKELPWERTDKVELLRNTVI